MADADHPHIKAVPVKGFLDMIGRNQGNLMLAAGTAADQADLETGRIHDSVLLCRRATDPELKFLELILGNIRGRLGHQAGSPLGFGKGNDIPDRFGIQ